MQDDAGLEKKLKGLHEKEREATITAIIKLATEAGFRFSSEEYTAFVKEELASQHSAGSMAEQELEAIAEVAPVLPSR